MKKCTMIKGAMTGLMAVFCAVFFSLQAKTVYIAPMGKSYNGNPPTSYDDPIGFNTFGASMPTSLLQAGDSMYFKGGQYNLTAKYTIVQSASSGAADKMTFVGSCPGETAVFDFRNEAYGTVGLQVSGNYVHLKGIVTCYAGKNGLYIGSSNCLIENCTSYGNCDSGIQLKSGSNNVVKNCDSFRNFDFKTSPAGGNADGFADKQYTDGGGNIYLGCRAWENSDDGWDFYEHKSGENTVTRLSDCWVFRNGRTSYDYINYPRYTDNASDRAYLDGVKKSGVEGVIIPADGNGDGFKLGGNSTVHHVILTNCVSYDNKLKGFAQNNNYGLMTVYNCTSYKNGDNNYGFTNANGEIILKNNISAGKISDTNKFSPSKKTIEYNNWNLGITVADDEFVSLPEIKGITPAAIAVNALPADRKVDGSLDLGNIFRLQATSQCIDKGLSVGLPFTGTAPDLGAFEFGLVSGLKDITLVEASTVVYPNPVQSEAKFIVQLAKSAQVKIELFDIYGRKIVTIADQQMREEINEVPFHRGNLTSGAYLYVVQCDGQKFGRHLVIQ